MIRFGLILALLVSGNLIAQSSLLLKPGPASSNDISVWNNASVPTGGNFEFEIYAWTNSGLPGFKRAFVEFDLSGIPAGSTILNASLNLFNNPSGSTFGNHSQQSGSNAVIIERVTSPWDQNTASWTNQPSTTTLNQVLGPATGSALANMAYSVTQLVQDMVDYPANSFGFGLRLQSENPFRSLIFASSEHPDSALWPELAVEFLPPSEDSCMFLKPGPQVGKDVAVWNNAPIQTGNTDEFEIYAWTNNGNLGFKRSYLDFDLSLIPANATITSAWIKLYNNPSGSTFGQHSQQSGTNELMVERVTAPWVENTIDWFSQPTVSTVNQKVVPASTSTNQDYVIDVKDLVQDMVNDPTNSFGFGFRLQNETLYRSLIFASSDHANSALWPELNVCWTAVPTITDEGIQESNWKIFPNPTNNLFNIQAPDGWAEQCQLHIINSRGELIWEGIFGEVNNVIQISLEKEPEGIYFIQFLTNDKTFVSRLIKQ